MMAIVADGTDHVAHIKCGTLPPRDNDKLVVLSSSSLHL